MHRPHASTFADHPQQMKKRVFSCAFAQNRRKTFGSACNTLCALSTLFACELAQEGPSGNNGIHPKSIRK